MIFFENTEVLKLTEEPANNLTESAHQVMAEQFVQDKKTDAFRTSETRNTGRSYQTKRSQHFQH